MTDSDTEPLTEPSFAIPRRPERRYSRGGGLSYEGTTVFTLTPDSVLGDSFALDGTDGIDAALSALTERVLDTEPYTYGDWFDLPMPVYLVHDGETSDVFRVAIRGGTIEFHVLPGTSSVGLSALYERLCEASARNVSEVESADLTWRVECRTDGDRPR